MYVGNPPSNALPPFELIDEKAFRDNIVGSFVSLPFSATETLPNAIMNNEDIVLAKKR